MCTILHTHSLSFLISLYICLQFEAKKRVPAEDALRHSYFRSLGDQVQTLADSEYKHYTMSNIHSASVSSPLFCLQLHPSSL